MIEIGRSGFKCNGRIKLIFIVNVFYKFFEMYLLYYNKRKERNIYVSIVLFFFNKIFFIVLLGNFENESRFYFIFNKFIIIN